MGGVKTAKNEKLALYGMKNRGILIPWFVCVRIQMLLAQLRKSYPELSLEMCEKQANPS
jgi:hypothetical protein